MLKMKLILNFKKKVIVKLIDVFTVFWYTRVWVERFGWWGDFVDVYLIVVLLDFVFLGFSLIRGFGGWLSGGVLRYM